MENMRIYETVRQAPENALKPITGGRLNGKTDINPMWRIKALTEQFGPCGIGWKYEILRQWLEPGANGEIAAFCDVSLYIKESGEWSGAIPGTGGSMFVSKEKSGLFVSDECFKMALTDALSVACKALGFGADVYWDRDTTKYSKPTNSPQKLPARMPGHDLVCDKCGGEIKGIKYQGYEYTPKEAAEVFGKCAKCLREEAAR